MPHGRVQWFSEERGFGFVQDEAGEELSVDHTGILGDDFTTLEEGSAVSFEVAEDGRGRRWAVRVTALEPHELHNNGRGDG